MVNDLNNTSPSELVIKQSCLSLAISIDQRITGIIGGFHLFDTDSKLEETIRFLSDLSPDMLYPCHCVSLKAKAQMLKYMDIEEVGVGLTIQL